MGGEVPLEESQVARANTRFFLDQSRKHAELDQAIPQAKHVGLVRILAC
jgi:hypothetical protein